MNIISEIDTNIVYCLIGKFSKDALDSLNIKSINYHYANNKNTNDSNLYYLVYMSDNFVLPINIGNDNLSKITKILCNITKDFPYLRIIAIIPNSEEEVYQNDRVLIINKFNTKQFIGSDTNNVIKTAMLSAYVWSMNKYSPSSKINNYINKSSTDGLYFNKYSTKAKFKIIMERKKINFPYVLFSYISDDGSSERKSIMPIVDGVRDLLKKSINVITTDRTYGNTLHYLKRCSYFIIFISSRYYNNTLLKKQIKYCIKNFKNYNTLFVIIDIVPNMKIMTGSEYIISSNPSEIYNKILSLLNN